MCPLPLIFRPFILYCINWVASPCSHFAFRESVRKPSWQRIYVRNKRKTDSVNLFPSTVQVVPIATRKLFLSAIKSSISIQKFTSWLLHHLFPINLIIAIYSFHFYLQLKFVIAIFKQPSRFHDIQKRGIDREYNYCYIFLFYSTKVISLYR